ncbi:MAG: DNA mismatch repair protein MutS [Bacilli bacterium]|nr:DNA mismatch repair protein MutS [Bacilli bacterium]
MKLSEVDKSKLSPGMLQYVNIKEQNMDVILFFRLGDFYEMFFEDAYTASRELELTLTSKNAGLDERVPMCGVPHHAVNIYLEKLIDKGYKVAICEQMEDPKYAKGVVKREVLQIVSKGTMMNSEFLDEKSNNYIGNIIDLNHAYVISYTDISTGEFNALMIEEDEDRLVSEVLSLGLNEIVLKSDFNKNIVSILKNKYKLNISIFDEEENVDDYSYIYEDVNDERYKIAITHLLSYLLNTQKRSLSHLQKVVIKKSNEYLKMDIYTKRNLELTESLRLKSRNYSLLWLLDKTKTAMGSRLLKSYIESPLIDKKEINKRYDIVEKLLEEFILKEDLKGLLFEVYDLERLSGRISYGNTNGRDLLQLKNSLKVLPDIKNILTKLNFHSDLETLPDLYDLLERSIDLDAPITIKEGGIIKTGYSKELDELKLAKTSGKDFILKMENEEKERTGIKNLKVGYNKVFGYYIEVSKGNISLIKDEYNYERKQTLANCERYVTPLLKEKEALILGAEERIINLEYNLFVEIRDIVKTYISRIQNIAKIIAEIDVLQSLSTVAEENNYVRPTITDERIIDIKDNRHPVVEKVLETTFVPNDIVMNKDTDILIITGPNMAGKSTYMRELVITVIMAQIGSFVPATSCTLPIFDKIFTRIGASDDLVSGDSTFMVEMKEANAAISNATKNSLIIFDELGRGTATYDGLSLAQSIIEYIHNNIKCKTLFSTHYHELTKLESHFKRIKNVHVSALEENGKITFLHKIKDGSIDKSYGIHVAKLANLPDSLINRANEILSGYENKNIEVKNQMSFELVEPKESEIENKIKELNPLEMTPIEALNTIYELKNSLKD